MTLTSSSEASLTVSFTLSNDAEVNELIDKIIQHDDENSRAFKKLTKACTSAIVNCQLLKTVNENLIKVAERQHKKIRRNKEHYEKVKIMNHEVLKKRRQQTVSKTVSKIVSKIKNKNDRNMSQVIKIFMKLDSSIFAENKKTSSKKKKVDNSSLEHLLENSFTKSSLF